MKTREELDQIELVPFKHLIQEQKIATVMTGHMALPLVTKDDTPCSLSSKITEDLLRGELGFKGVIVTDCMEMDAIAETYTSQKGAVMALEAGADIAMVSHTIERQRGGIELAYEWVEDGKLSLPVLLSSGERINSLKDRFTGNWDEVLDRHVDGKDWATLKEANAELSSRVYKLSTAMLTPQLTLPPLNPPLNGMMLVLTPETESLNKAVDDPEEVQRVVAGNQTPIRNTAGPSYGTFVAAVARRTKTEHLVYLKTDKDLSKYDEALREAVAVIFVTRGADRSDWQIDCLRDALKRARNGPVILLASYTPYDLYNAQDLSVPAIATFEFTRPALEAASAVIFGEQEPMGSIPVRVHPKTS
jgi:beta-N-acetylhexosaminidase